MQQLMDTVQSLVATYGLQVVAAIVIFFVGKWIARLLAGMLERAMVRAGTDPMLTKFAVSITYFALFIFVVMAALNQLGVQTTSFIAVLGAAGLAIGLALQGSLSNFAAGVMIILFRPFKVGDYIEAAGTAGSVEEILIFSTKLKSPDNKQLYVPNGAIINGNITNYSAKDMRRVDLVFGCAYGDDMAKVKSLLKEILDADERVLDDPAYTIGLLQLGDNSVNWAVRPWVKTADYWSVYFDLNETVKRRFDEAGISIPFPQRDVHIIKDEAA
ncbi:MAG: mechanosensitive ion channel [Gammaproteobacteria bacterium]|nr:mechanosensitive ion channel [Gammaproteobacteria bacterium]